MNSLYTLGVRQTSSIQADLEKMRGGESSASLHGLYENTTLTFHSLFTDLRSLITSLGQIAASLAALHRTIEDYDSMARREIIKAKQEKAQM